jgi:hypothetical protein
VVLCVVELGFWVMILSFEFENFGVLVCVFVGEFRFRLVVAYVWLWGCWVLDIRFGGIIR